MTRWRSVLFTPGTRPDRVEKAWQSGAADVVVADLEDAVPPGEKDAARAAVAQVLEAVDEATCARAVRINAFPGQWAEADLEAILPARPDLVVVPKAEDAEALGTLAERLGHPTRMLAILETARGVLHAEEIAAAPGVDAIAFGAEDLAADAGMRRRADNHEVAVPRSLVALAAASAGVAAIDMITADIQDTDRFRREATEAIDLGYAGKMCIHPRQVEAMHEVCRPGADDLAWARRVEEAVSSSGVQDGGVIVVDGQMVDVPLIRQARSILARADD